MLIMLFYEIFVILQLEIRVYLALLLNTYRKEIMLSAVMLAYEPGQT